MDDVITNIKRTCAEFNRQLAELPRGTPIYDGMPLFSVPQDAKVEITQEVDKDGLHLHIVSDEPIRNLTLDAHNLEP